MPELNPWFETLCHFGSAACDGLLAARATARDRDASTSASAEAEVPAAWRARRPSERAAPERAAAAPAANTVSAPDAPPTSTASAPASPTEPQAPSAKIELVFTRTLQPWARTVPPTRQSPHSPASSQPPPSSPQVTMPPAAAKIHEAATITAPCSGLESPTSEPQLELDFSPRPAAQATVPPADPQVTGVVTGEPAQLGTLLASVVRVLDDVVTQAVGQAVTDALAKMEQSHARDLTALVERFDAALERQDARMHELLERQDARLRDVLVSQARAHADELRAALREVQAERPAQPDAADEHATIPQAFEELQESLRVGFGEVRGALDRNHYALMKLVRAELAPLAAAALTRPANLEIAHKAAPDETSPPCQPRPRATPARSPPSREDPAASRRRLDAIHDDEDGDETEERASGPLRYRLPDDDADTPCAQEASP